MGEKQNNNILFWEKRSLERNAKLELKNYEKDMLIYLKDNIDDHKNVLVVGCGGGRVIKDLELLLKPKLIVGLDISENNIYEARKNYESHKNILFEHLDFMLYENKDILFDLIFFPNNTYSYIINSLNIQQKIDYLLNRNGFLLLEVPHISRFNNKISKMFFRLTSLFYASNIYNNLKIKYRVFDERLLSSDFSGFKSCDIRVIRTKENRNNTLIAVFQKTLG